MQFSSNSNEAIRGLIRACPTPIGQYRQARLQMRDRAIALQSFEYARNRRKAEIGLKEIEIQRLRRSPKEDEFAEKEIELQVVIIQSEIAQLRLDLRQEEELIADAMREINVCSDEITRLKQETGLEFEKLSEAHEQALMAEETRQRTIRHLAADWLATRIGQSPGGVEALLELDTENRQLFFQYVQSVGTALIPPQNNHLNGSNG